MVWCVVKSYEKSTFVFYTVPKSWIYEYEEQTFVYYPPPEAFKHITKAIISLTPHQTSWGDWPAQVIPHDFAKFLDAKSVEAEVASDKTAWDRFIKNGVPNEFGVGKRNIKKPRKLGDKSTTEYDSDSSVSIENNAMEMPSPPKKSQKTTPEKRKLFSNNDAPSPRKKTGPPQPDKLVSPKKNTLTSPKKYPLANKVTKELAQGTKQKIPSPAKAIPPIKTTKAQPTPLLDKSRPSTSKAKVDFMPKTTAASAVTKEKSKPVILDMEQVLAFDTSDVERALLQPGIEIVIAPVDATNGTYGTRQITIEELALFNAKKHIILDKKMDKVLDHLDRSSNLEGSLKFSVPCKDYKRVLIVDKLLQDDKTQYELLVKVLTHQPSHVSRVGSMVNVMLRFLMSDSAAKKFCYTGSDKKYEFKSTMLNQGIAEAVLALKKTDNVGVEVVGKAVASWLSQAKKRIDNRSTHTKGPKKTSKKGKIKKPKNIEDLQTSQSEGEEGGE